MRRAVRDLYLEVIPADGVVDQLATLPGGTHVGITCSPTRGIDATLDLVERLDSLPLNPVPHIAARQVRDTAHLRDILDRLAAHRVDSLFVPAGDIREPVGQFASSLDLLRVMADIGHRLKEIGVTAYPEGHPFIGTETLESALREKQAYATYFVTQMCFDMERIIDWLRDIRSRDIQLEGWVGLPGAVDRKQLLATSLRIGVGDSAKFALRQKSLVGRLLKSGRYDPGALLDGLARHLDDSTLNIGGLYVFSFNQIESTRRWQAEMLERFV